MQASGEENPGSSKRSWFLSFLIPIMRYFLHWLTPGPWEATQVLPSSTSPDLALLGPGNTHTQDIGAVTDGSPLSRGERCIELRLTIRTPRVSPEKSFLAEQVIASSGNVEAMGRICKGPGRT